jgi:hypothetical protein
MLAPISMMGVMLSRRRLQVCPQAASGQYIRHFGGCSERWDRRAIRALMDAVGLSEIAAGAGPAYRERKADFKAADAEQQGNRVKKFVTKA